MTREPRGITVEIVDLTELAAEATEEARTEDYIGAEQQLEFGYSPYGILTAPDGMWLVCNEGVAWALHNTVQMDLYSATYEGNVKKSFSVMPTVTATVSKEQLMSARTGERADLAHFVRSFGPRLDQNLQNLYDLVGANA